MKLKTKPKQESKSGTLKAAGDVQQSDLGLINKYTRVPLTADQVYTFKLALCDNEIDRQYDQFTPNALNQLSVLFIGKTVIFNHSWNAKDQTARIYSTQVESVQGQTTKDGQPYMRLIAMAYMLNRHSNEEIIANIDGGILKEGSVAFSNDSDTCSICGNGYYSGNCPHWRGDTYTENGVEKTCYVILDDITDAYEFSLVAVPAQPRAGITKSFKDGRTLSAETLKQLSAARVLRLQAENCEKQARTIEDELVGEWPEDNPTGAPEGETEDPDNRAEIPSCENNESEEVKAFKAEIRFLTAESASCICSSCAHSDNCQRAGAACCVCSNCSMASQCSKPGASGCKCNMCTMAENNCCQPGSNNCLCSSCSNQDCKKGKM